MSIRFEWRGNPDTDNGIATYSTDTNTFDLWLPSIQHARQIEQALCIAYADGRRKGHREMIGQLDALLEAHGNLEVLISDHEINHRPSHSRSD